MPNNWPSRASHVLYGSQYKLVRRRANLEMIA
jgi:hypothetical protein